MRKRNFIRTTVEVPIYHVHWYDPQTKKEEQADVKTIPEGVAVISCEEVRRQVLHLRMPINVFMELAEEYTPAVRESN